MEGVSFTGPHHHDAKPTPTVIVPALLCCPTITNKLGEREGDHVGDLRDLNGDKLTASTNKGRPNGLDPDVTVDDPDGPVGGANGQDRAAATQQPRTPRRELRAHGCHQLSHPSVVCWITITAWASRW